MAEETALTFRGGVGRQICRARLGAFGGDRAAEGLMVMRMADALRGREASLADRPPGAPPRIPDALMTETGAATCAASAVGLLGRDVPGGADEFTARAGDERTALPGTGRGFTGT